MRHLIFLSMASVALPLYAHPGHSPFEHGLSHALLSPHHCFSLLAAGAILCVVGKIVARPFVSLALRSVGALALALGATGAMLAL